MRATRLLAALAHLASAAAAAAVSRCPARGLQACPAPWEHSLLQTQAYTRFGYAAGRLGPPAEGAELPEIPAFSLQNMPTADMILDGVEAPAFVDYTSEVIPRSVAAPALTAMFQAPAGATMQHGTTFAPDPAGPTLHWDPMPAPAPAAAPAAPAALDKTPVPGAPAPAQAPAAPDPAALDKVPVPGDLAPAQVPPEWQEPPPAFATSPPPVALGPPPMALAPPRSCSPQCSWKCDDPVCDEVCTPKCQPPRCETRCAAPDISQCRMDCLKPQCTVVCPKMGSPRVDSPEKCSTVCGDPICHLVCPEQQPCRNVCEEPACTWDCGPPPKCATPRCQLACETPRNCMGNTYKELPALAPGEVSIGDFSAKDGTAMVSLLQADGAIRRERTAMPAHSGAERTRPPLPGRSQV